MKDVIDRSTRLYALQFKLKDGDAGQKSAKEVINALLEEMQTDMTERQYIDVLEGISRDVIHTLWSARYKGGTDKYITQCLEKLNVPATAENTAEVLGLLLRTSRDLNKSYYDGFSASLQYRMTRKLADKLHYVSEQLTHILIDSPDRNEIFRRIESLLREVETLCTLTTPPPQSTSES
jgi:hypothetical protein